MRQPEVRPGSRLAVGRAPLKDAARRKRGGLTAVLDRARPAADRILGQGEETVPFSRTKKHHW